MALPLQLPPWHVVEFFCYGVCQTHELFKQVANLKLHHGDAWFTLFSCDLCCCATLWDVHPMQVACLALKASQAQKQTRPWPNDQQLQALTIMKSLQPWRTGPTSKHKGIPCVIILTFASNITEMLIFIGQKNLRSTLEFFLWWCTIFQHWTILK